MITTGITRRIDNLGRIVIPKEIRNNMHIKQNELLEICMYDNETLSIKKHTLIDKGNEFINNFIKELSKTIDGNIFITDLSNIIYSNQMIEDNMLDVGIEKLIINSNNSIQLNELKLTKTINLTNNIYINHINLNGDVIGLIIINTNNTNHLDLINFSIKFIQNHLSDF